MQDQRSEVVTPTDLFGYLPTDFTETTNAAQREITEYFDGISLTRREVRERTKAALRYSIDKQIDGVVNAPPSAGKSHGAAKVIAEMDAKAAYFAPRTELYEQMKAWCEDENLTVKVLPSMPRECQSYQPDTEAYNLYHRGREPSKIHTETSACTEDCPYMQQLPVLNAEEIDKYVPLDQYDVLIGHTNHAYVEPYLRNRVLFFDDISKLSFIESHDVTSAKIRAVLHHEKFPCDTVEELYACRHNSSARTRAADQLEAIDVDPWGDERKTTHADVEMIVETVLKAEKLENGFSHYHHHPESDGSGAEYIGVTDGDHTVYLLRRPPISSAPTAAILLNAYPLLHASKPAWFNWRTGAAASLIKPLSLEERRKYISDVLNIDVIQTTEYIKPYSSGKKEHIALEKDSKLINYIADEHETEVSVITPNKAKSRFEQRDLPVEAYKNYAEVESSNEFGDKTVGLVLGSPEWQIHQKTKQIGALMGQCVEWNGERGVKKSFGEAGDPIMKAFREHMVGQAILRFGREAQGATVYVHTAAIPEDIPIADSFDSELGDSFVSVSFQLVQYMLKDDKEVFETSELYDAIQGTSQQVRNVLKEKDIFEQVEQGSGPIPAKWALQYSESDDW
jgi:hypothetical protein